LLPFLFASLLFFFFLFYSLISAADLKEGEEVDGKLTRRLHRNNNGAISGSDNETNRCINVPLECRTGVCHMKGLDLKFRTALVL
jgi:hypothetical protein